MEGPSSSIQATNQDSEFLKYLAISMFFYGEP